MITLWACMFESFAELPVAIFKKLIHHLHQISENTNHFQTKIKWKFFIEESILQLKRNLSKSQNIMDHICPSKHTLDSDRNDAALYYQ